MANYDTVKLGEVARSVSDTHPQRDGELIFLNTSDIARGQILHRNYSPVKSMPGQAKKSVKSGDILFSEIRPANGRWALLRESAEDFIVSTKLMVIRPIDDRLDPLFLYQFLTNSETTAHLHLMAESRSGTFPQITFDEVASLDIPFPPLNDQVRIASTIGALDLKIESNQNAQLVGRELLQALYLQSAESAEGQVMQIGSVLDESRAKVGKDFANSATVLSAVASGHLRKSDEQFNKQVYSKSIEKYLLVPPGCLAYNPARANIGSIGINDFQVNGAVSPVYVVAAIRQPWHSWIRTSLRTALFNQQVRTLSTGSVRQSIRYSDFASIEVPAPTLIALDNFNQQALDWFNLDQQLEHENQRLERLRNALLPGLFSGRLRVSEPKGFGAGVMR